MENLIVYTKTVNMDNMLSHYDRDKFIKFCKECKNYGNRWSCPPFDFSEETLLKKYKYVKLVVTKIIIDEEMISKLSENKEIFEYTEKVINKAKEQTEPKILKMELDSQGSMALASGGCRLCETCMRVSGKKCCKPTQGRYSLESLGFDVVGIVEDFFNIKMFWAKGKLPQYFLLVNALLTNNML